MCQAAFGTGATMRCCGVVTGRIMMLRTAISNLAAEPGDQEERLRGMVVRDELAMDCR